ncbi:MAG: NAD(P)H-binding protein [Anaerolineales bacterium]
MTSKILLTGGSGTLGRKLFPPLLKAGYSVRISSRGPRKGGIPAEVEWAQTSLETGEGLAQAVQDVETIIHAASDVMNAKKIDIEGTRTLVEQAQQAGVRHLFYISIVGIENFPGFAYYAAKLEAERIIATSGVPYTILRTTQFHELLDQVFLPPLFKLPFIAPVPTDLKFQVVDSGEVAARIAELVQQGPQGHVPDMGGPKVYPMGELAQTWAAAHNVKKKILQWPVPGNTGHAFREGKNTTPDRSGKITWEQYLAVKYSVDSIRAQNFGERLKVEG